ncbi:nitrilase [Chondrus crispus]|uniref:Nitrilase n=1 Tax=Chondrus crispus TaxID=2769 RepID=R7QJE6_CHOCR|nr:nitrilase [Chondrus crispus]CDF37581.1 nitrilase [Chondrus crispus]|eukprot:XP_005717452.1 nitrilase [Chondrus crispus]
MSSSTPNKVPSSPPASPFKLALCQTPVTLDKEENIAVARDYLMRAAAAGASLAVLPECFNCPYDTACFREYAEELPAVGFKPTEDHSSPSLKMLRQTAQETKMFIVGGSVPEIANDGNIYNSSLSVSPDGTVVAKHRKAHLFDIDVPGGIRFKESDVLSPGGSATAFFAPEIDCTVGVGICYDVRFPELAMLQARELGAKVLVFPGAFNMTTGPAHWELLLRGRALDNQVFVAACSPSRSEGGDGYTAWGHSMVVDPWGTVLASADEKPALVVTTIDLGRLDTVRKSIPTSQQRREDIYRLQSVP